MMAAAPSEKSGLDPAALGGIILFIATVLALIIANSGFSQNYFTALEQPLTVGIAPLALTKTALHWINDGLMAIFFLQVGLEIKREMLQGALSHRKSAALPFIAALGGMIVPALIYVAFNWNDAAALRGWAIPAATDIAFVLGVLAVLGSRVPNGLKVFLLALAIIDDLGAIIIIALFYTTNLSLSALGLAGVGLAMLVALNMSGVKRTWPYLLVGAFIWVCVLKSGIHATLAGVVTALAIPMSGRPEEERSPLRDLEHALVPWVSFAIVPIFAFANAGVALGEITSDMVLAPVPLGIALGLFFGKMIGVFGFSRLAISSGIGEMPQSTSNIQLLGASVLAGIGFTMSLFIGMLAFTDPLLGSELRIGVLSGSVVSAIVGYLILRLAYRPAGQGEVAR
ncbi:MAG: Na+/H+ antiporter NhaA [Hyphomicrobium sp.]|nr:MAG: Na+/H+ antiporter NhaA [Hyphomicrobium sp.]PPD00519.1 MAG: Na+/H+ antiporter NhaA [Hyphomicrobium sp.]